MNNCRIPLMDYDKPEAGHSNTRDHSLGYGQNGKGHVDRSHEQSKSWSDKQALETGLTDKEPL